MANAENVQPPQPKKPDPAVYEERPELKTMYQPVASHEGDPWSKMLKGFSPEEAAKFRDQVYMTVNSQIAKERDRMVKAIKKLRDQE